MDIPGQPYLSILLSKEEAWAILSDFDQLMKASEDRLQSIGSTSDAAQSAMLMHGFARDHYHLFLVGHYKVKEIGRGIKAALETQNDTVLFNLTRTFLEHTAALAYQTNALEKAVTDLPKKTNIKSFREAIAQHQRKANKLYYNKSAEIHVHDMIKELVRHYDAARREYDQLCEFVHPNYGSNKLVSSGELGTGQIRPHPDELSDELIKARRVIERCAKLVDDDFTKTAAHLLGVKLGSWIKIACRDGVRLSQIFSVRGATMGDGKIMETAIFFKKARTHEEAIEAFYDYLRTEKIKMLNRQPAAVEDGHLYEKIVTDKGTLWVKYRIPEQ